MKEPKDAEISKYKRIIRRLESDKRKLISDVKTLEAALKVTQKYLDIKTENLDLEQLLDAVKEDKSLKQIEKEHNKKNGCEVCGSGNTATMKGAYGKLKLCRDCGAKKMVK